VCIIVGTSVSNRRLELISVDPQAGPAGTEIGSWQRDYLMADPRDYNMAEDIEGLSSTVPLRAQTGGPLHLLRQTKMGVPAKAKGAAAKPVAAAQKAVPRGAAKHVKALKGKRAQSLCGVGSGCEFESDQNVGSAEVIRMSTDPDVRARRALFREIDTNGDGQLDFEEIKQYLEGLGVSMPDADLEALIANVDLDGSGTLSQRELDRMFGETSERNPAGPSDAVMAEIKDAVIEYQDEQQRQRKIWEGDSDPTRFRAAARAALKPAGKHTAARTQVLCGLDAGCEDDMANEINNAALVDAQTVSADMPAYPDADTIDEVYQAMDEKKKLEDAADRQRRGTKVAN
jgi:hypothetical protein